MNATKINLKIKQGSTFREAFNWLAAGAPVNLTGWSARMQIRTEHDSPVVIHELTSESGGITIRPLSGGFDLFISSNDTERFNFEDAVYDIELVDGHGEATRIVEGRVRLSPEVTR